MPCFSDSSSVMYLSMPSPRLISTRNSSPQLDEIHQIWTLVSGGFPHREALIEHLGTELEAVEQRRVAEAHGLLATATEKLMDIAHLTRGPVSCWINVQLLSSDLAVSVWI
jgi:hypothetical protein